MTEIPITMTTQIHQWHQVDTTPQDWEAYFTSRISRQPLCVCPLMNYPQQGHFHGVEDDGQHIVITRCLYCGAVVAFKGVICAEDVPN